MTSNQIEALPALLDADYGSYRAIIRARMADALENGNVVTDMTNTLGDFMRALSHTLDEYEAPAGTLERITAAIQG